MYTLYPLKFNNLIYLLVNKLRLKTFSDTLTHCHYEL